MQCLVNPDDDVKKPDYFESDGEDKSDAEDESDGEDDESPFCPQTPPQPPVQMPTAQVQFPQAPVMWDSAEYVPTNIPFTKKMSF